MSYEMIKPALDFNEVFRLAFDTTLSLDMTKHHSTKIGLNFVQFATDRGFFDEAAKISRSMLAGTRTWDEKQENDTIALIKQLIDIGLRSGQFLVNNELNQYLSDPESLRLVVIREVNTSFNGEEIRDKSMPIDLLLISGYRTLLQVAAEYGRESIVRNILGRNPALSMNTAPANCAGRTALQAAAECGHVRIVQLLLVTGADISAEPVKSGGRTALQAAAGSGHVEIVEILLAAQAAVNAKPSNKFGRTALQAAAGGGHVEVVRILLAAKADVNATPCKDRGRTALQAAAGSGHVTIVKILLVAKADVNAKPSIENGQTALQAAAEGGHVKVVELLLGAGVDVKNISDGLYEAACSGHAVVVKLLLAANADVNIKSHYHSTPLFRAAMNGDATVVRLLLTAGADINITHDGKTVVQAAAQGGFHEVLELLRAVSSFSTS